MRGLPSRLLANLFACSGVAYLFANWMNVHLAELVLKPVPVLLLLAVVMRRSRGGAPSTLVALGLLCSAIGDVLLAWSDPAFIAGLVAFLVAHLLYLGAFVLQDRALLLGRLLPFAVATAGVFAWLHPHLGELAVPVAVYVLAITVMVWRASVLAGRVHLGGAAFLGAGLFVLSDTLLAINKFAHGFAFADLAVMLTYWGAQLWIARSVLRPTR